MNNAVNNHTNISIARSAGQSAVPTCDGLLQALGQTTTCAAIREYVGRFSTFAERGVNNPSFPTECFVLFNAINRVIQTDIAIDNARSNMPPNCEVAVRACPYLLQSLDKLDLLGKINVCGFYQIFFKLACQSTDNCAVVLSSNLQDTVLQINHGVYFDAVVDALEDPIIVNNENAVTTIAFLKNILESATNLGIDKLARINRLVEVAAGHKLHLDATDGVKLVLCFAALIQRFTSMNVTEYNKQLSSYIMDALQPLRQVPGVYEAITNVARISPDTVRPHVISITSVTVIDDSDSNRLRQAKQECLNELRQIREQSVATRKELDIQPEEMDVVQMSDNLPACLTQAPAVITTTSAQLTLPLSHQISLRIAEAYQEALLPESEDEVYPAQGIMAAIMISCNPAADATTKDASVSFLVGYRGSICLMPREVAADASQFIEYFEANAANVPQVYKDYLVTKFGGMWYDAVRRIVVPDDGLGIDLSDSDGEDDDDSAMEIDENSNNVDGDYEAASRIVSMAVVAATFGRLLNMLSPRLMHSFISFLHKLGKLEQSDIAISILREMNADTPTELAEVADQLHSELVQYHQNREPSSDVESQKGQYIGHVVLQHKDHLLSFAHDKRLPAEERISILTSVAGLLDLPASCDAKVSQYLQDQFFARADIIDLLGKDDVTVEDIESCTVTFHELGKFCSKALYIDTGILDRMDNIFTTHYELFAENEIWLDMLGSVSIPHQNILQTCQQDMPRVNRCVYDNPTARSAA